MFVRGVIDYEILYVLVSAWMTFRYPLPRKRLGKNYGNFLLVSSLKTNSSYCWARWFHIFVYSIHKNARSYYFFWSIFVFKNASAGQFVFYFGGGE